MPVPEPTGAILPGDTAVVCHGAYKGAEAPIEWMSINGTAWIYVQEKEKSFTTQTSLEQQPSYIMVPVEVHEIRVYRAARTLNFTKERGYDVYAGDCVEVARGKWFRSKGTVQAVDFDKASLDLVCEMDGQKVSILLYSLLF